jgi:hypothetical protein
MLQSAKWRIAITHSRDDIVKKSKWWPFQQFIRQLRTLDVFAERLLRFLYHRGVHFVAHFRFDLSFPVEMRIARLSDGDRRNRILRLFFARSHNPMAFQ